MSADPFRVQVDVGELLDDEEQAVLLVEFGDQGGESVAVEDVADVRGETFDVVEQVVDEAGRVGGELAEVPDGGVEERQPELRLEHDERVDAEALGILVFGDHLALGGGEDRVEAAQDRERQDDVAVLVGLVRAAKQVRDVPDQAGVGGGHGGGSFVLDRGL